MNYINKVGLRNVMYGKLPSGPSLHSACYHTAHPPAAPPQLLVPIATSMRMANPCILRAVCVWSRARLPLPSHFSRLVL